MTNFERNLRQICTYWEVTGTDQFNKPTFATPIVLNCRWEDISELVIDKHGREMTSKSRIFLAESVRAEGYLWLGESVLTNPLLIEGAHEVMQVKSVPDLRYTKSMWTIWL